MYILAFQTAFVIILAAFISSTTSYGEDEFGQVMQFTLEHELTKGKFTKRAQLSVRSFTSEVITYREDAQLTDDDLRALIALAEAKDIYRARILVTVGSKAEYVTGFVYACDLVHGGLRNNVTLAFNGHGSLVGLHLAVSDSTRATFESCGLPAALRSPGALPRSFGTQAVAVRPVQGPAPETQIYINRMEEEKKRKQEAEQGDNRSFLAKYWMYIVPAVVIVMMFQNDPNAAGGGAGGGGGGGS